MTTAPQLVTIIIAATSMLVLMLEALGNFKSRTFFEKPHIRLVTLGALFAGLLLVTGNLLADDEVARRPINYVNDISTTFLIINTIIATLLSRQTLSENQNGEIYFLVLASLALAVSNLCTTSLIVKMVMITAWLIVMTTLAIRSTKGGKKAEIGLKLTFSCILIVIQFLGAIFFLKHVGVSLELEQLTIDTAINHNMALAGLILITSVGLSLTATPPFHFGYIDCADGGNISVAFLLLSNAFIQGCALLLNVQTVLIRSGIDVEPLGYALTAGFVILWLRAIDQNKIRRTVSYVAASVGPLFSMSMLFGLSVMMPKMIFVLAIYAFVTLTLFTLYGTLAFMSPINLPSQTWEDMSGFGRTNPSHTVTFLIAISAIAGLPGTLGYFIKLSLIAPLKDSMGFSGAIFLSIAIGAACAMRVFVFMFSKQSPIDRKPLEQTPPVSLLLAALVLIVLGFFPFVR